MLDQREAVVGQHVRRVGGGVVRPGAVPVAPQVRQDDPVTVPGELPGDSAVDPAHLGGAQITVDQYQRPALPELAVSEPHAVPAGKMMDLSLSHRRRYLQSAGVLIRRTSYGLRCAAD